MSDFDIILDSSQQNLKEVATRILQMHNLKMLYLQQNFIKELPKNFFLNLPQLSWLDLRHNHLTTIPETIAHHQHLENLLLSDNKIEMLPNELGVVPKLKVVQIANNPIVYPPSRIIAEGTNAICAYLRNQYNKIVLPPSQSDLTAEIHEDDKVLRDEKEIRVMVDYCNELFPMQESIDSSLIVKGLSKVKREDSAIIHKMTNSSPNKLLLKSYYEDDDRFAKASTQTSDSISYIPSPYKHAWMDKLKQLLNEQERILQQERNLEALTSWRHQRKLEPPRPASREKTAPPYATDPQYDSILSKEDVQKEIDKMIQMHKRQPKRQDLEKLISELVSQLKDMETTCGSLESPRSEIEAAGTQIVKIMEVHKKLLKLQQTNDLMLQ